MAEQPCVIGKHITIQGDVSGKEPLVVEGQIDGKVSLSANLHLRPDAVMNANVEGAEITVEGKLTGDVTSSQRIVVTETGTLIGNLNAPQVIIAEGAKFSGYIEMDVSLPPGVTE